MSDPDAVAQNLIIPTSDTAPFTGAFGEGEAVYISALIDGELKQIPVFTQIRLPAIVEGTETISLSSAYEGQLCIYVVDELGYYHIRSLGYSKDRYNSYNGLECDDASVLASDDASDMFVEKNPEMITNVQRISFGEMYLGSRENVDSVLANENTKIIIKYNLEGSGTCEYVTFGYDSIIKRSLSKSGTVNLGLSFPFDRMTYLLANNTDSDECEELVVIYGEITQYDDCDYNYEFNGSVSGKPTSYDNFNAKSYTVRKCTNVVESDGTLKYEGLYDHGVQFTNVMNLNAAVYNRLRIRMKADVEFSEDESANFYFLRKGETNFTEQKSYSFSFLDCAGVDSEGWMIFDIDLSNLAIWRGTITGFRFDPTNIEGKYEIDYIRFLSGTTYNYDEISDEELKANGFTPTRILLDEDFENGFDVRPIINSYKEIGHFEYTGSGDDSNNLWAIGPWWTHNSDGLKPEMATNCIWNNRDTTLGEYTIGDDKGTTRLSINPNDPEGTTVSFTLNGSKIYNGTPHYKDDASTPNINEENRKWWPHLLIEQDATICPIEDLERNSADAERIYVEYDIRMPKYTPSAVEEGTNRCQFLAYFYLRPKDEWPKTKNRIWFGLGLFDDKGGIAQHETWNPDSAANQYIYCIPGETIYEGMENSYYEMVKDATDTVSSNEWRHFRVDITPHIDRAVEWINRDNGFGKEVTKEDLFFEGVNIGFEIHGNVDCTFEIRNFNMVSYN